VQTSFGGKTGRNNPNKLYAIDIAETIVAALDMPRRVLWPELAVANNPGRTAKHDGRSGYRGRRSGTRKTGHDQQRCDHGDEQRDGRWASSRLIAVDEADDLCHGQYAPR
jgi:hypothetical protein